MWEAGPRIHGRTTYANGHHRPALIARRGRTLDALQEPIGSGRWEGCHANNGRAPHLNRPRTAQSSTIITHYR